jgi:hypothetical protein
MAEIRSVRVQVMMSEEEVEKIDAWRFARHIGSRSDALRRLAMDAVRKDADAPPPEPRARRSDAPRLRVDLPGQEGVGTIQMPPRKAIMQWHSRKRPNAKFSKIDVGGIGLTAHWRLDEILSVQATTLEQAHALPAFEPA